MDVFYYLLIMFPFAWIFIFMQDKLGQLKYFLACFLIGVISSLIGVLVVKNGGLENPGPFYLGSQMALSFVVVFSLYRIPYHYFFKREPEVSQVMTHSVDILSAMIVLGGSIMLPIFLDVNLFHVITKE